jgi:hypothetical protein
MKQVCPWCLARFVLPEQSLFARAHVFRILWDYAHMLLGDWWGLFIMIWSLGRPVSTRIDLLQRTFSRVSGLVNTFICDRIDGILF